MKRTFLPTAESYWASEDGATITKVSPRGSITLYAVTLPGSRRPEWFDSLAEAKRYGEEH